MKYFSLLLPSMTTQKGLVLLFCLLLMPSVSAIASDIKPFVKGSFRQIQQQRTEKPYIIAFWSETCAYCMKELALMGELLKTYKDIEVVSITTDPFLETDTVERILSSKQLEHVEKWVFADHYAERLYFVVDSKWRGELPLTYFFDRNNNRLKHMGVIKENELIEWMAEQNTKPIN